MSKEDSRSSSGFWNENATHFWINKKTFKIRGDFKSLSRTIRECHHSYSSSQLLLLLRPKGVNVI
jgi:hypothetical protein